MRPRVSISRCVCPSIHPWVRWSAKPSSIIVILGLFTLLMQSNVIPIEDDDRINIITIIIIIIIIAFILFPLTNSSFILIRHGVQDIVVVVVICVVVVFITALSSSSSPWSSSSPSPSFYSLSFATSSPDISFQMRLNSFTNPSFPSAIFIFHQYRSRNTPPPLFLKCCDFHHQHRRHHHQSFL